MTKPIFDSRQYWRQRAKNQIRLNEALKGRLNQVLADYDQVEAELVGLLSVDSSITPNTTLMMMSHEDLAIYADQLRAKCIRLQAGEQHAA